MGVTKKDAGCRLLCMPFAGSLKHRVLLALQSLHGEKTSVPLLKDSGVRWDVKWVRCGKKGCELEPGVIGDKFRGVVGCTGGEKSCELCKGAAGWEWGCGQADVVLRGPR